MPDLCKCLLVELWSGQRMLWLYCGISMFVWNRNGCEGFAPDVAITSLYMCIAMGRQAPPSLCFPGLPSKPS